MPWDIEQVRDAVEQVESERATLIRAMQQYEQAWRLDFWTGEEKKAARDDRRKLYTSPLPRNTVSLATNLISGKVNITCPAQEETEESVNEADARARFLELLIQKQAKTLDQGLIDALGWFGVVRGRMALQVAWIYDLLSPQQRVFQPPILYRPLDPMGVGIKRDHFGTRWAYHKYREKIVSAKARYPEVFKDGLVEAQAGADHEVEVTDFWYTDEKGKVWHCVLVDDAFAVKPKKTRYPVIPIMERNNDPSPSSSERWRSASILEGTLETWGELNFLHSMHLSSIGRYFWPALFLTNPDQEDIKPLDTGMGAINELPRNVGFTAPPNDKPDVGLATSAIEMLSKYEQESTFPDMLYGDAGAMRAAYGLNMMASTAVRRIRSTKEQMQILVQSANEIALWCVHNYAPNGITLYGYDATEKKNIAVRLDSSMIPNRYENSVDIEANVTGAQMQEMIMGIQLVTNKIISRGTFRRDWIPSDKEPPPDEEIRVLIERIEDDPDLLAARLREAYLDYYGEELPAGEPDWQKTPQALPQQPMAPVPPAGQPPMMPPVQPPMPPPQNPMMPPGGPVMPPGQVLGSPEFQGGVNPDMMGFDPNDPQTQMIMQMIATGQMPGPQDQNLMLQDQYRRR
jgi:hypothetical protein